MEKFYTKKEYLGFYAQKKQTNKQTNKKERFFSEKELNDFFSNLDNYLEINNVKVCSYERDYKKYPKIESKPLYYNDLACPKLKGKQGKSIWTSFLDSQFILLSRTMNKKTFYTLKEYKHILYYCYLNNQQYLGSIELIDILQQAISILLDNRNLHKYYYNYLIKRVNAKKTVKSYKKYIASFVYTKIKQYIISLFYSTDVTVYASYKMQSDKFLAKNNTSLVNYTQSLVKHTNKEEEKRLNRDIYLNNFKFLDKYEKLIKNNRPMQLDTIDSLDFNVEALPFNDISKQSKPFKINNLPLNRKEKRFIVLRLHNFSYNRITKRLKYKNLEGLKKLINRLNKKLSIYNKNEFMKRIS